MEASVVARVSFRQTRELNELLVRNGLLELLTLRFYRFWARTALRRHLWSAISIDNEALEYTGEARELLFGFMVTLSVLLPILLVMNGAFLLFNANGISYAVLSGLHYAFFAFIGAAGSYAAWRYRVASTIWRGINADVDGSAIVFALRYSGWTVAFCLTAGLSVPWACADLARYRFRNLRWGNFRGQFHGVPLGLLRYWLSLWVPLFCPLYLCAAYLVILAGGDIGGLTRELAGLLGYVNDPDEAPILCALVLLFLGYQLALFYFGARWQAWCLDSLSIGRLEFSCRLPEVMTPPVFRGFVMVAIYALVATCLIINANTGEEGVFAELDYNASIWACLAAAAAAVIIGNILWQCLIEMPFLENLISHTRLQNIGAASEAEAVSGHTPRFSEGLWDITDVAHI